MIFGGSANDRRMYSLTCERALGLEDQRMSQPGRFMIRSMASANSLREK